MTDRELMQQALTALLHHQEQTRPIERTGIAIAALRTALAQPAPSNQSSGNSGTLSDDDERLNAALMHVLSGKSEQPAPAPVVPDGWVMVPTLVTEEMLLAGVEHVARDDEDDKYRARGCVLAIWLNMIAAAPGSAPAVREPLTEPVACLIRYRNCTPARRAHDGQAHWNDWSEWEVATLAHGKAVTHPSRNPTEDDEWQMKPLYETPAVQPLAAVNRYCAAGMCLPKDKHEDGCTAHGIGTTGDKP